MDVDVNDWFEGCGNAYCDHRSTGGRAWCMDCQEWCYPYAFCPRGQLAALEAKLAGPSVPPGAGDDGNDR